MQPKCNLIIDSCCDLPYEMVDREGVELIQFPYIMSDGEHSDDLFRSVTPHDFYESMRKGETPSTAQIPMTVYRDYFTRAIESGVPTVYLCFTSGLSSSYDVAMLVHDQLMVEHPGAELYVVDTLQASLTEGFLVYEALRQRDKGLTAAELASWAEEARNFVECEFMVEDLDALKRGGRIPSSVAYAGSKLDVKPMLYIPADGTLSLCGVARGRKKGVRQLAERCLTRMAPPSQGNFVFIGGSDCPKDQERLRELLRKGDEDLLILESSIGPTIGSHVGPGMLAVVFWGKDRREELSMGDRIAKRVKGE